MENLATKMSRSMVRTDQLPWGASGKERGQTCRHDPSPALAPAWPRRPGTHRPSARSWRLSPCPPQTCPRGTKAEFSTALTQSSHPMCPPPSRHGQPHLLAALGCIQHQPAAVGCPAQPRQSTAVDAREGSCNESGSTQHCSVPPTAVPRSVLTPCLPWHSLQHRAGLLGIPVVLWKTWDGMSFRGFQPACLCFIPGRGHDHPPASPHPDTGTLPLPRCPASVPQGCSPCGGGCIAGGGQKRCSPGRRCGSGRG